LDHEFLTLQATDFRWDGEDNIFNEVFIKRNMEQLKLTFSFFSDVSSSWSQTKNGTFYPNRVHQRIM
jgi:hypothetical protein